MATTFKRQGSAVMVEIDGKNYSVPCSAFIYPHPRSERLVVISDEIVPQKENEGLLIDTANVTGIAFATRNELIDKLTTLFFF